MDYHLHEFTVVDSAKSRIVQFGSPDEDSFEVTARAPSWQVRISDYFTEGSVPARYVYDFGDDWHHAIVYEGIRDRDAFRQYPRCLGGANACPPEDCGGPSGFVEFKRAVSDPNHPEHEEMLAWAGGSFDPTAFDAASVTFDDPRKRWQIAFGE
jgi:hypothetical protein